VRKYQHWNDEFRKGQEASTKGSRTETEAIVIAQRESIALAEVPTDRTRMLSPFGDNDGRRTNHQMRRHRLPG
jgi:hypothetical protein